MAYSSSNSDRCDHSPYSVVEYIELYGAHLDGRQFEALRLAGDAKIIRHVGTRSMHDTTAGAWIKQCWH